jgi:hypothetical protein
VLLPPQRELFDPRPVAETPAGSPVPDWAFLTDPVARLAAFAADPSQPPARRSEADGVLRIQRQRLESLEARLTLSAPEVVPLGVLMLVPQDCSDL